MTAVALMTDATAQTYDESGDTKYRSLDSVVVTGHRISSSLRHADDGTSIWSMSMMNELPKILGNADPLHYTQLLPSVQTNNEYDNGLHIQGCDNSHNSVGVEGVPIYNVAHLMGFFSVFNASHYSSLQLQTSAKDASYMNRLGGFLTMSLPDSIDKKSSGEFSVGLISSQGTLRLPLGKKHQLNVSLRASYLNLLYSQWLEIDDNTMRYSFYDTNITYIYRPDRFNTLNIDGYLGEDAGKMGMGDYAANLDAKWGNSYIATHWTYDKDGVRMRNTLYYTRFHNRYTLNMNAMNISLPSDISDIGFKNDVTIGGSHFGIEAAWHTINPQKPELKGGFLNPAAAKVPGTTRSLEASIHYGIALPLTDNIAIAPGARATAYRVDGSTKWALDPSLSLTWKTTPLWSNRIGFACRHQFLLQTGINALGLPTTFWTSTAIDDIPVQSQQGIHLNSDIKILDGWYSINLELYYKWLQHQQEYFGTFYDFINSPYDIRDMLHHGRGRNYGINIILNKLKGDLTGWISYSYGRAQRQFSDIGSGRWYPSNHERIHELNTVITQKLGRRWSIGMTGVWATGTPFTAPRNFQIINGNLITCYGEHNANRLPAYFRIDLSANYKLKEAKGRESGINFSVYNMTYSSNYIYYYMKIYNDQYYYKGLSFLTRILPSVSYYMKF